MPISCSRYSVRLLLRCGSRIRYKCPHRLSWSLTTPSKEGSGLFGPIIRAGNPDTWRKLYTYESYQYKDMSTETVGERSADWQAH